MFLILLHTTAAFIGPTRLSPMTIRSGLDSSNIGKAESPFPQSPITHISGSLSKRCLSPYLTTGCPSTTKIFDKVPLLCRSNRYCSFRGASNHPYAFRQQLATVRLAVGEAHSKIVRFSVSHIPGTIIVSP